jgi:predicted CxxxxCH...CXXCH cytochrome family protein
VIPDECPNPECKADLTAEGAILELAYTLTTQPCHNDGDGYLEYPESATEWYESQIVFGYECAECHRNLAGGGGL